MAAGTTSKAIRLFFFATIAQGLDDVLVNYKESVSASVGQHADLPCVMSEGRHHNVAQIEWKKVEDGLESKLVVYNPIFLAPHKFRSNISLQLCTSNGSESQLIGSILQLQDLTIWDSGSYLCELTTFPFGSIKRVMHLQVLDLQLSAQVWPKQEVTEGEMVKILCNSTPPADLYSLWPSKSKSSPMKNISGVFSLPNVTRHDSDVYTCQAEWGSSDRQNHTRNTSVNVTVNYLDPKCDARSIIEVYPGQNVSLSCEFIASKALWYTWIKDNVTLGNSSCLLLRALDRKQTGLYTLTATIEGSAGLNRQVAFVLTLHRALMTEMQTDTSPTLPNHTSGLVNASVTIPSSEHSTDATTLSPHPTATQWLNHSANITAVAHSSLSSTIQSSQGTPMVTHSSNTVSRFSTTLSITRNPGSQGNQRHMVLISLPFLALIIMIAFLYRRKVIQKRMDKPPPFKPPPPPVKYTSVRPHLRPPDHTEGLTDTVFIYRDTPLVVQTA